VGAVLVATASAMILSLARAKSRAQTAEASIRSRADGAFARISCERPGQIIELYRNRPASNARRPCTRPESDNVGGLSMVGRGGSIPASDNQEFPTKHTKNTK